MAKHTGTDLCCTGIWGSVFYGESGLILHFYHEIVHVLRGHWLVWELDLWLHTVDITVFLFEDGKDGIVLVAEPQIPVNLKSMPAGLAIYFRWGWMPQ